MVKCVVCSKEAITPCIYCNKPFYCTVKCKEIGENKHICAVHPEHRLPADYLTRAVLDDEYPVDEQTLKDYGFVNCKTDQEYQYLFSLYVGLIKLLEATRDELHDHCMRNKLAELITTKYNKRKGLYTSFYYEWFLQNQDIVKNGNKMED